MKKSLLESLGSLGSGANINTYFQNIAQQPAPLQQATPIPQPQSQTMWEPSSATVGVQLKNSSQLHGWQRQIVDELSQPNHDVFIMTESPGGGKTLPVIVYWAEKLLGINVTLDPPNPNDPGDIHRAQVTLDNLKKIIEHPENLPQIMWFSPIRALTDQTVKDEFITNFVSFILQYINYFQYQNRNLFLPNQQNQNMYRLVNNNLNQTVMNMATQQSLKERLNYIYNNLTNLSNTLLYQNLPAEQITQIEENISNLSTEYFENVTKAVKEFVTTQLVGIKYADGDTIENHQKGGTIKPVIITVYESSPGFIDRMKNLKLMVFDEIQKAELTADGIENVDKRAKQISSAIDYTLSSRAAKSAKMVCLTGTQNEKTAARLIKFYNVAYGRHFTVPFVSEARNTARIKIRSYDQLADFNYTKNLVKKFLAAGERQICFVFFSKYKINEIAKYCFGGSFGHEVGPQPKTGIGYKKPFYSQKDVDIVVGESRIADITNPMIRNAAGSRLGIMYGPERKGGQIVNPSDSQDNVIIQDLFSKGKIDIVLTTDYIGEGLNINIKEMYIPSVEKAGNEKIPIGNLSQLLNRVGRIPNLNCTIFTPSVFVDDVMDALNASSTDFDDVDAAKSTMGKIRYIVNSLIG